MGYLVLFLGILFLGFVFNIFLKNIKTTFSLPYILLLGFFASAPFLYYLRVYIFDNLFTAIAVWFICSALATSIVLYKRIYSFHFNGKKFIIFLLIFFSALVLFNKTFSYTDSHFLISTNLYLDMGAHIPFIRSFSNDTNFPFTVPFFSSSNVTYHFMFDFLTGVFEYAGLRIDIAYNIISALILTSMFFVFLDFSEFLFKKQSIGVIAFAIFLFPFNYGFVEQVLNSNGNFFSINEYRFNSFLGSNTAGNFLYVNTYLNQRHLLFSLSISLVIVLFVLSLVKTAPKHKLLMSILTGGFISFLVLWNMPIVIMLTVLFCCFALFYKSRLIVNVLIGLCICALIQYIPLIYSHSAGIKFAPGFLVHQQFTFSNWISLWVINLGIAAILIPSSFFICNTYQKKFFLSLIPLFLIPNMLQFTNDIFDNHKFVNFWYLFVSFFIAYVIYMFFTKKTYRFLAVLLLFLLLSTSITNYMVIKNDIYEHMPDYKKNNLVQYVLKNTSQQDIILSSGEIYDPISLAGGRTYLGRSHYIYLYGGDPSSNVVVVNNFFNAKTVVQITSIIDKESIDYVVLYKDKRVKNNKKFNRSILDKSLLKIYEDNFGIIYKT